MDADAAVEQHDVTPQGEDQVVVRIRVEGLLPQPLDRRDRAAFEPMV